jgi:hypothetical protein
MDETEQVSRLIGDIYDASLDPDRWEDVLGKAGDFLSAATATLGSFDVVRRNVNLTKTWGYDPDYLRLYMERYAPINPLIPSSWLASVGDVVSAADLMPYEEFQQTAMYREWGVPQGYIDAAQVMLEKTATATAVFQVIRHQRNGRVDDELRRRMTLLMPHFRRAILIGKVIDLHKVEAAAFADTLDGLAAGMFIVDGNARIVHANVPVAPCWQRVTCSRGWAGSCRHTTPRLSRPCTTSSGQPRTATPQSERAASLSRCHLGTGTISWRMCCR